MSYKKKYMMKKELKQVGDFIPGVIYKEGDFPAAYMHMFTEVKDEPASDKKKGKKEKVEEKPEEKDINR